MIALNTQQQNGVSSKHTSNPKTNPRTSSRHPRQIPQPIKSWTNKPVRINTGKTRGENGIITSPRMLTSGKGAAVPVKKQAVGGEWALKECEEHTAWVNGLLKKGRQRPIGDLRKSISDGLMLVTLLEILFHSKITGIQTRPIIRAQRVENINLCLRFLEGKGVDIHHLSADDITDGNLQAALETISAIRRRFETNHTGSSLTNGSVNGSIDKSEMTIGTGREGSIHSQFSATTSMNTPRGLQNGDIKGGVNGDLLPGTMADSPPEESPRLPADEGQIMSTTELSTQGISQQHGIEMRRQKFLDQPATSQSAIRPQPLRPPPMAWNSAVNGALTNGRSPAVRESLSMTVEERLKSLLDTPNPGGMGAGSQYLYDEGELLELPPPKLRSYLYDDDDDEDDDDDYHPDEDSQLHAMLDDPDKFEEYPKDWDRYVSGYVPSSKAEKKEGPRAQTLLEQPADKIPLTSHNKSLQFFHAPPTQHMGPMQNNINGYHNGPQLLSMPGPDNNGMYTMQTPNSRLQHPAYQTPPNQRRLPSYQDHIQRHPMRQNQYSNGHDPERSGGTSTPSAFRPPNNFDQSHGQDLQYNHVNNRTPEQHIPRENIRPNHAYNHTSQLTNHNRTASHDRTNGPIPDIRGLQSFVPSPSSSSSRSNTPELPPLSPETTASESPPESPQPTKNKSRSLSVASFPYSIRSSNSVDKEVKEASQAVFTKKKKSPMPGRHAATVPKTPETNKKSNGGKESGEKKRKKTSRERSSTVSSATKESANHRKKSSKGMFSSHRHSSSKPEHINLSSSDEDIKPPASKPERKPRKKAPSSIPQPPHIKDGDLDGTSADSIREQLMALESMYKDILQVIGTNKSETAIKETPSRKPVRRHISTLASPRAAARPRSAAKTQKQREKDIKTVNRRFARVESHVVTLARSVASLSSEIRSQNAILREIDSLRSEVDRLHDTQLLDSSHNSMLRSPDSMLRSPDSMFRSSDSMFSSVSRFRPMISQHTSPQRIKKLTKFFGEEPPLLRMFLQELGYEKYAAIFEKEGIGMVELPYLSEERLELIGIPIGPRLRILQEAQLMV